MTNIEKPPDAINNIIKTINPVHQAYSKQNKDYNKYFLSLNLDVLNFMKTLNKLTKKKVSSSLFETLYKKNDTNKFSYEKDILKTFNKLKNMKNNKFIPEDLNDNFKFKFKFNEKNTKKKKTIKNNSKNQRNKNKENDNFYYGITLDPGRYDPKYNLIFKRIPDVYFEKNKYNIPNVNEMSNTNIKNEQNFKENEINKENKDNINQEKNKVEINFKNKFRKINARGRNREQQLVYLSDIDKTRKDNISKLISSNTSIHNQNPNIKIFYSSMINFQPSKILTPTFHNIDLHILNKSHNSSFYHNQNRNQNKKNTKIFSSDLQSPNFFHFPSTLNNTYFEEKEKAILNRCKSSKISNVKIFSFNKMKGRKKNLFGGKKLSRSSVYNPNYDFITPKQIKLKTKYEKLQNFKKYAVNKIIRNYYCFSPYDYFIFDINNKKNKTIDKNYIINIKKNYNI